MSAAAVPTDVADAVDTPPVQQQAWNLAQPAPEKPKEPVAASEEIREAVASQSQTWGDVIDRLDSWAVTLGETTVSVWDALIVLLIIAALLLTAHMISRLGRALLRRITRLDNAQRALAEKLVAIAVWGVTFFIGIGLIGVDLTALAVFSGAFGLAIGFGLQKTLGNLIAGIILLMDRSIKPGDVISVADTAGNETFGQIRKIGIRAISIVTRDRKEYLIPNENLMVNQVENWSYSSRDVRVKAPVNVAYGSDLDLVEKLLHEAVKGTPRVLERREATVRLMGFDESAIRFEVRFWIEDPEDGVNAVRSEVFKRIWRIFKEHGIVMPFPQREITLKSDKQFEQLIAALAQRAGKPPETGQDQPGS